MLVQKAGEKEGTRPPPGIPPPDWEALQLQWKQRKEDEGVQETRVTLGPCSVSLGHDDPETEDYRSHSPMYDERHEFGWDNEHPKRMVDVKKFVIERKPISNREYYEFWSKKSGVKPPTNWIVNESGVLVSVFALMMSTSDMWPFVGQNPLWTRTTFCRSRLAAGGVV